jgi:transcriptional regulator with XRE-family HTH domain
MPSKHLQPTTAIDAELSDRLLKDEAFRRRYIRRWAQVEVASAIRALRKARRKSQAEVAALVLTRQSAISRIEKAEYDGWTFKTLIGIAEALQARLRVSFDPIEDVAMAYRTRPSMSATGEERDTDSTASTGASLTPGAETLAAVAGLTLSSDAHVDLVNGGSSTIPMVM